MGSSSLSNCDIIECAIEGGNRWLAKSVDGGEGSCFGGGDCEWVRMEGLCGFEMVSSLLCGLVCWLRVLLFGDGGVRLARKLWKFSKSLGNF